MKNVIFIIVTVVFCFSCGETKDRYDKMTYSSFPQNVTLKGENIKLADSLAISITEIKIVDSLCCIYDRNSQDKMFHLFSYPDFDYIYSFGNYGKGHNEFLYASFQLSDQYVYTWFDMKNKMSVFDIRNRKHEPDRVYTYETISEFTSFDLIKDSVFICNSIRDNHHRLMFMSMDGKLLDSMLKIPPIDPALGCNPATVWNSTIQYNAKNDAIVVATMFGEIVDIVKRKENKTVSIVGPEGKPYPVMKNDLQFGSEVLGFADLCLTDQFIYALYSGEKLDDLLQGINGDLPRIHVYDYDGNPVKVIHVDKKLYSIHVDEKLQKIYGTVQGEENPLYVYDMK